MDSTRWQEILVSAQKGSTQAWGQIYERYERRVFGLCLRLLRDSSEAEDAASECFERAFLALSRYDVERSFEPWLISLSSRHCLNRLRRRSTERRLFWNEAERPSQPETQSSPLAAMESERQRRALKEAMQLLPDKYRVPLVLKYLADHSYDEIAEHLGMSRNNVAVTLHRAKIALRAIMENQSNSGGSSKGRAR